MQSTDILLTIKLKEQLFVDAKRIRLLKEIDRCGSINQAAKNAQVSYKSAWDHLSAMDSISPKPLLERNAGGRNGGGTMLTAYAKRLLQLYDLLEQTQQKAFEILQDEDISLDSSLTATAKFSPQSSARNQFFGRVKSVIEQGVRCEVLIDIEALPQPMQAAITQASRERLQLEEGKEVMLMIKAPWLKLHSSPEQGINCFSAVVEQITPNGTSQELALRIGSQRCYATAEVSQQFGVGQSVWVSIDPEQIVLLSL